MATRTFTEKKKREMLAANKVKISGSEKKVTSNTYDISPP